MEQLLLKADFFLKNKLDKELRVLLESRDFHIIAQVIDALANGKRKAFSVLPPEKQAQTALVLTEDSKKRVFSRLPDQMIARFLHFLDEDDATDVLQYLSEHHRSTTLALMQPEKKKKIEKLLKFGSETAGGLMDLNFVVVSPSDSFKIAIEVIQKQMVGTRHMPTVLVVSSLGMLKGYIPERTLLFPPTSPTVDDHTVPLPVVSHKMDREKVMEVMQRMRTETLCVSDEHEQVLGVIHLRDLVGIAQKEATEDIYSFAGVDLEEHAMDAAYSKVKRRYNWLLVNLLTAFLASFVVSLFEGTIAQFSILAVYMPIVAGQGGNAATQALAVVVRGLAIGEIGWDKAKKVIIREAVAGTINGFITGLFAAGAAVAFGAPITLGLVLAAAMIINLFVAGLFGAFIPFALKALKIDPATASTVFVTTMTDICGFFAFLGLGALFMRG